MIRLQAEHRIFAPSFSEVTEQFEGVAPWNFPWNFEGTVEMVVKFVNILVVVQHNDT